MRRYFGHVQLGGHPESDSEHTGGIPHYSWPGNKHPAGEAGGMWLGNGWIDYSDSVKL